MLSFSEEHILTGNILPILVRLTLPVLIGTAVQVLYNVTDVFWISRISTSDPSLTGGVGLVFPLYFILVAFSNGMTVGTASYIARSVGGSNRNEQSAILSIGIATSVVVSTIVIAAGLFFTESLLALVGAEGNYLLHAASYFRVFLFGFPFMFAGAFGMGVLQGEGAMKPVMNALLLSTVLNIVLDPVLIFLLQLGVQGAALGTVAAQAASTGYLAWILLRPEAELDIHVIPRWHYLHKLRDVFAVGLPQSMQLLLMGFSVLVISRIVMSIDPLAMTAYAVCQRIDQLTYIPVFALNFAVLTVVGQNYGANQYVRVRRAFIDGALLSALLVGTIAAVLFATAPLLFSFFTNHAEVHGYAVLHTRLMAPGAILIAMGMLSISTFQAMGKPTPAFVLTFLMFIGLPVPTISLLVHTFGLGMYGVWGGALSSFLISALLGVLWFKLSLSRKSAEYDEECRVNTGLSTEFS
jgi:putative MATE family efflux protein